MKKENISIKELVDIVDRLGAEGGGSVEVTGTWKGKPCSIIVAQTEWHDSQVCLVGGYGQDVSAIRPDDVSETLHCVIGNYLDGDKFSVESL
jgi:uncharacterized Fe-S cluster-containing protein